MEPPGFQAKEMIIEHINNVDQGPVIVRDGPCLEKTPEVRGEYSRYVPYISEPGIVHYL
jgi:hypothetical protein